MDYLKQRLLEPSTLRGLILLASGLTGYGLSDAKVDDIITIGMALAGLFGAALPDRMGRDG